MLKDKESWFLGGLVILIFLGLAVGIGYVQYKVDDYRADTQNIRNKYLPMIDVLNNRVLTLENQVKDIRSFLRQSNENNLAFLRQKINKLDLELSHKYAEIEKNKIEIEKQKKEIEKLKKDLDKIKTKNVV